MESDQRRKVAKEKIAAIINFRSAELGIGVRELARRAGVPPATVSQIGNFTRVPGPITLAKLANALQLDSGLREIFMEEGAVLSSRMKSFSEMATPLEIIRSFVGTFGYRFNIVPEDVIRLVTDERLERSPWDFVIELSNKRLLAIKFKPDCFFLTFASSLESLCCGLDFDFERAGLIKIALNHGP